jgi:WD40 repeat protein
LTDEDRRQVLEGFNRAWAIRALKAGFATGLWVGLVNAAVAVACVHGAKGMIGLALGPVAQLDSPSTVRLLGSEHAIWKVTFGPFSKHILVNRKGDTYLADVETQAVHTHWPHRNGPLGLSPDARSALIDGDYMKGDYGLQLLDLGTGARSNLGLSVAGASQLAFVQGGRAIAVRHDSTIRLYSIHGGLIRELQKPKEFVGFVVEFASTPYSGILAASYQHASSGAVVIWALETGAIVRTIHVGGGVRAVALSPNGKILAAGVGTDVQLWDTASGRRLRSMPGHSHVVQQFAFSPDGSLLASVDKGDRPIQLPCYVGHCEGITVRLWEVATGRGLKQAILRAHKMNPSIAISADGRYLAANATTSPNDFGSGFTVWKIR